MKPSYYTVVVRGYNERFCLCDNVLQIFIIHLQVFLYNYFSMKLCRTDIAWSSQHIDIIFLIASSYHIHTYALLFVSSIASIHSFCSLLTFHHFCLFISKNSISFPFFVNGRIIMQSGTHGLTHSLLFLFLTHRDFVQVDCAR